MFVIKILTVATPTWVSRFVARHQVVALTGQPATAKKFRSYKAASDWAVKHSDVGYGLSLLDCGIEEETK